MLLGMVLVGLLEATLGLVYGVLIVTYRKVAMFQQQ
jgi:hypothetical protein